jgi:nucleoside 2-deoxyribosyltransferase
MKKIYVAYKFKDADPPVLREKLEKLSEIIEEGLNCKTFIFFRDEQDWGKKKIEIKEVVKKAIERVKECDGIIVEGTEKANGAYFETGFAKALGKKVIVIHKKGTETNFLDSVADISIEYKDFNDLKEKLKALKK